MRSWPLNKYHLCEILSLNGMTTRCGSLHWVILPSPLPKCIKFAFALRIRRQPALALRPRKDATRNPKQGYQWPHNRTCEFVHQKHFRKFLDLLLTVALDSSIDWVLVWARWPFAMLPIVLTMVVFYSPEPIQPSISSETRLFMVINMEILGKWVSIWIINGTICIGKKISRVLSTECMNIAVANWNAIKISGMGADYQEQQYNLDKLLFSSGSFF